MGESGAPAASGSVRAATVLTLHGKIAGVDRAKKTVTLEFNGKTVNLRVENPTNLEPAQVGEPVLVRYDEVVKIRKKRSGESISSISVKDGIMTAQPGGQPGAVAEQRVKVVVKVMEVDPTDGTVTVEGPDGASEPSRQWTPASSGKSRQETNSW